MRSRAAQLIEDHFRVSADATEDLLVWENCAQDPFSEVTLVPAVFVTQSTRDQWIDPLTVGQARGRV